MPYRSGSVNNVGLQCVKCQYEITAVQNYLECDICHGTYHLKCENLLGKHINLIAEEPSWLCKNCKTKSQKVGAVNTESYKRKLNDTQSKSTESLAKKANIEGTSDDKFDKLMSLIATSHAELKSLMETMEVTITEVKVNQSFLSEQFDSINKKIDNVTSDQKNLKKDFGVLAKSQNDTSRIVSNLQYEIDILKQRDLANNIIVGGLPKNADPSSTITKIMKILDMKTTIEDITEARILTNKNNEPHSLQINNNEIQKNLMIVKFKRNEDKKELMEKKKSKKSIFTFELGLNTNRDDQIYIRDHVTSFKMNLFRETKILKDQLKFKHLWMNETRILLRKDDASKIYSINSTADLEYIKKINFNQNNITH